MDIRQLEAFVYTVKYQSFSLAAQKLYISQPTVSAHIRSLEEEFHTQLLKRTTKSLSLTPAGTKLYSYATEILTLQQKAIVELANETKPQLRIGASSVPSLYFLPELLSAYHAVHPDIRVYASCSDSLDVVHKVDDGICDIGMASRDLKDSEKEAGLNGQTIAMDGIAVIVNQANPTDELSVEQIGSIFTGDLTKWDEIVK